MPDAVSYRSLSRNKEMEMSEIITLKSICTELKLETREARERLRAAIRDPGKHPTLAAEHKPKTAWQWVKGSASENEARRAVEGLPPEKEVRVTPNAPVDREGRAPVKA